MPLAAGLRPDLWGSCSAHPDPIAVMKGERKGLGIGKRRKGREGKEVKG